MSYEIKVTRFTDGAELYVETEDKFDAGHLLKLVRENYVVVIEWEVMTAYIVNDYDNNRVIFRIYEEGCFDGFAHLSYQEALELCNIEKVLWG
mgnify:CR=1 FL=1